MKTKLLSMLLLVTMLATIMGALIPTAEVSAEGGGQQVWFITDISTLAASPSAGTGHILISPPQAFSSPLTATEAITIPAGHWRGHISLNSSYTGSVSINVGYGVEGNISYSGTDDLPNTMYQNGFDFDIDAVSMSIAEGNSLYIKFGAASGTPDILTGGIYSYICSPAGSPSFPTPTQPTYGLTLSVNGGGTTNPAASATAYNYYEGTTVPLLAVPSGENHFTGWSGSVSGTTNPTSITMNTTSAVTAHFTSPVDMVLTTDTNSRVVNDTFDVNIEIQSGSQEVVGVDVYLDFDPAKLTVVDMDSGTAGIQITGGADLIQVIQNSADNSAGHIDYCAGILGDEGDGYPSGTFTVATIRFQALAETSPTTSVSFSSSADRPTYVSGDVLGTEVTGSLTSGIYTIASEVDIDVSVTLQGTNRPDSAWLIPLTVKFFASGADVLNDTPINSFTLNASKVDNTAVISCSNVLSGNYDITAGSDHTLLNVLRNVTIDSGTSNIYMGTLLEGNANNDDRISISDFGILSGCYGKLSTDLAYDSEADFDGNGIVNIADFSLLSGNYNLISPIEVQ